MRSSPLQVGSCAFCGPPKHASFRKCLAEHLYGLFRYVWFVIELYHHAGIRHPPQQISQGFETTFGLAIDPNDSLADDQPVHIDLITQDFENLAYLLLPMAVAALMKGSTYDYYAYALALA